MIGADTLTCRQGVRVGTGKCRDGVSGKSSSMMTRKHKLGWFIMEQGQFAAEFRQVHKRMQKLAPLRLKQLALEHQDKDGAVARATRKALTDPRYLDYIEQDGGRWLREHAPPEFSERRISCIITQSSRGACDFT